MEKNVCKINGLEFFYTRQGSGEVVLMVHGITTYSFIWRRMLPHLQEEMDLICVDLLGCGASSKSLDESYSIKNQAHLLKEFMDKLGVAKFHFVGHDVGGGIGQIFAVHYPEMLVSLSLINSVAYDFWPVQPIITMRTPILRQIAMATLDMGALRMIIGRGLYHKERLTKELVELFWEPMKTKQGRKAFLHFAACLDNHHMLEIEEKLHGLDLPVLIIRGEADVYLSGAIAEKLHQNLSDSQLVSIATGSHFIQEDEPEMVAKTVKDFIMGVADGR